MKYINRRQSILILFLCALVAVLLYTLFAGFVPENKVQFVQQGLSATAVKSIAYAESRSFVISGLDYIVYFAIAFAVVFSTIAVIFVVSILRYKYLRLKQKKLIKDNSIIVCDK